MHHFRPVIDKANGVPIEWVDPAEVTPTQPIVTTVIKKAHHPNAARLLTDFLLSEEGARILVTQGWMPVRKGVDLGKQSDVAKVEMFRHQRCELRQGSSRQRKSVQRDLW